MTALIIFAAVIGIVRIIDARRDRRKAEALAATIREAARTSRELRAACSRYDVAVHRVPSRRTVAIKPGIARQISEIERRWR